MKKELGGPICDGETFMKLSASLLVLLFVLAAGNAFAHGDKVHVSGTVEKISAESMLVKTRDGKSVEVKLVASTVYISHVAGKAARPADASEDQPGKLSDVHCRSYKFDFPAFSIPRLLQHGLRADFFTRSADMDFIAVSE